MMECDGAIRLVQFVVNGWVFVGMLALLAIMVWSACNLVLVNRENRQ